MLPRTLPLLAALALGACVAAADAEKAASQESTATRSPVEQAWENVRASYVEHFNEGHADRVAALFADDAWSLPADGLLLEGRTEIQNSLERAFLFAPVVDITMTDRLVLGDVGVALGTYRTSLTLEDDARVSYGGSWLNLMRKVAGEWRIAGTIVNYDAVRPQGWRWSYAAEGDLPADEGTMAEAVERYATHWSMGRADMVAQTYVEDAVVSFPSGGWLRGRAAVAASLGENMPEGSTITVHDVATLPLAEGWALDGGWYAVEGADGARLWGGAYVHLMRRQRDGSWKIHWALANALPPRA